MNSCVKEVRQFSVTGLRSVTRRAGVVARAVLMATAVLTGVACRGPGENPPRIGTDIAEPTLDSPPRTGFLRDYTSLRPSQLYPNAWIERSPAVSGYHGFIIDDVRVLATSTTDGTALDRSRADSLSASFTSELRQAVGTVYCIETQPGPSIARIRAAITEVRTSRFPSDGGSGAMGGAAMELEVVDSLSGDRLVAVIDSGLVSNYDAPGMPTDEWEHARITFRHWASRLMFRLGAYGTGEVSPSTGS